MSKPKTAVGAEDPEPERVVELHDGEQRVDVTPLKAQGRGEWVSLDDLSAARALDMLTTLRATGPVLVSATLADPLDQTVVASHSYQGAWVALGVWRFDQPSLEMAARVAGWSTVEVLGPGKLRLS